MRRIALFVHYNKKNEVNSHALYALEKIRSIYNNIVVVSNSALSENDRQLILRRCDRLIERRNKGYDFAALRDAIGDIGWEEICAYDTLTIMNDTCYFPIFPMASIVTGFDKDESIDFWGASIHGETSTGMPGTNGPVPEHIQSYFMSFKRHVVLSKEFQKFWDNIQDLVVVEEVIRKYETRLTPLLSGCGFKYDAIYNPRKYNDEKIIDAVYQIPEQLIERHFPFIKLKVVNVGNRDAIINKLKICNSGFPSILIIRHENINRHRYRGYVKLILKKIIKKV